MLVAILNDTIMGNSLREALGLVIGEGQWREAKTVAEVRAQHSVSMVCVTDASDSTTEGRVLVQELLSIGVAALGPDEHGRFCLTCLPWPQQFLRSPFDLTIRVALSFFHTELRKRAPKLSRDPEGIQSVTDRYVNPLVLLGYLQAEWRVAFSALAGKAGTANAGGDIMRARRAICDELSSLRKGWRKP